MSTSSTVHRFDVKGMTCQHCVRAVTRAIQAGDEAADVRVDLASGTVEVVSTQPPEQIRQAIRDEGYEVAGD